MQINNAYYEYIVCSFSTLTVFNWLLSISKSMHAQRFPADWAAECHDKYPCHISWAEISILIRLWIARLFIWCGLIWRERRVLTKHEESNKYRVYIPTDPVNGPYTLNNIGSSKKTFQENPARVLLGLHSDSTERFLLKNLCCLECILVWLDVESTSMTTSMTCRQRWHKVQCSAQGYHNWQASLDMPIEFINY